MGCYFIGYPESQDVLNFVLLLEVQRSWKQVKPNLLRTLILVGEVISLGQSFSKNDMYLLISLKERLKCLRLLEPQENGDIRNKIQEEQRIG